MIICAPDKKSLITNLICVAFIAFSYFWNTQPYAPILHNIGFFALSGAITNWLAIYMLFDKIPFVFGSGVIPLRFEEFKLGIRNLIMQEFFTPENVNAHWETIARDLDYERMVQTLMDHFLETKMGKMIALLGSNSALEGMKKPLIEKLQQAVKDIAPQANLTIENIVDQRLAKLTPVMVKNIIQTMIRQHLGWLVVWGGVFGGLIGLATSFI